MKFLYLVVFVFGQMYLSAQCSKSGDFVAADPNAYPISGTASYVVDDQGNQMVRFEENFATVQGATLLVFLSKTGALDTDNDIQISESKLGPGIGTGDPITGLHEFPVPAEISISDFDHVLIQCVSINALWGNVAFGEVEGSCDITSDTKDLYSTRVSIYPNPTTEYIALENLPTELQDDMNIEIFNIVGKRVHQTTMANSNQISIAHLKDGIYILKMESGEFKQTTRIVKK